MIIRILGSNVNLEEQRGEFVNNICQFQLFFSLAEELTEA